MKYFIALRTLPIIFFLALLVFAAPYAMAGQSGDDASGGTAAEMNIKPSSGLDMHTDSKDSPAKQKDNIPLLPQLPLSDDLKVDPSLGGSPLKEFSGKKSDTDYRAGAGIKLRF